MEFHPIAKRRYIHVFPGDPFLSEIGDCYRSAAKRISWMTVEELSSWSSDRSDWSDHRAVVIFWGILPTSVVPDRRHAVLALRYTESVGTPEGLTEIGRAIVDNFRSIASVPDVLLVGTKTVSEFWSGVFRSVAVAPIGYEPDVLGRPDWSADKRHSAAFRGNYIGRRVWILKMLQRRVRGFKWVHGFGITRKAELDRCLADLYIGHSVEPSFPGMRIWQGIASSSAIVTEPRDAWPAVKDRHYIEVPEIDPDMPDLFVDRLNEILADKDRLRSISETAHRELSVYTIERCMEEFVVPATCNLEAR